MHARGVRHPLSIEIIAKQTEKKLEKPMDESILTRMWMIVARELTVATMRLLWAFPRCVYHMPY